MNLFLVLLFLLVFANPAISQNKYIPPDPYTITAGKQHFSKYMIISPGYLGPQALPVPRLVNGINPERTQMGMEYEYFNGDHEQTHDVLMLFRIPISNGKVAVEFIYAPYEFYRMDSVTSRERRTRDGIETAGNSLGDVYFGTHIQLLKNHRWLPDLLFGMSCRTASGTGLADARHTDTPGYYLDLSAGKTYAFGQSDKVRLRWSALGGFYVWQTYLDNYPQNDAWMYGMGIELRYSGLHFLNTIRGYSGYMNNGDKPLVYRTELGIREGRAALILGYEIGLRDYPHSGVKIGFRID